VSVGRGLNRSCWAGENFERFFYFSYFVTAVALSSQNTRSYALILSSLCCLQTLHFSATSATTLNIPTFIAHMT